MRPIIIDWVQTSDDYFCQSQSYTLNAPLSFANAVRASQIASRTGDVAFSSDAAYVNNLPLTFNNATGVPNIMLSATSEVVPVPPGQARNLILTLTAVLATSVTFLVTGIGVNGTQVSESVTLSTVGAGTDVDYTSNRYTIITSIVPTAITSGNSGNQIEIGIAGNGIIVPPTLDVWNKNSLYTISITDVVNTVVFNVYYSNLPTMTFVDRIQNFTEYTAANSFLLPVTNANVIISASSAIGSFPATLTANQVASFSTMQVPMTTLYATFTSATTGSCTVTILQQGGKY